ncbi:MAG: ribosome maturation factor RimP [Myxococcota bacterium]|jgi:ribosome maturation factor RimP
MNTKAKETVRRAREVILPVVARYNYQLVEVEFVQEPYGAVLRLYIDKLGGITLEDCAKLSDEVGDLLEAKGTVDGAYHLEVSSPGVDRRVRDPLDFDRFAGSKVKIKCDAPVNGRKMFTGILKGMDGDCVAVDVDGTVFKLPIDLIEKANLKHDWDK